MNVWSIKLTKQYREYIIYQRASKLVQIIENDYSNLIEAAKKSKIRKQNPYFEEKMNWDCKIWFKLANEIKYMRSESYDIRIARLAAIILQDKYSPVAKLLKDGI